MRKILKSSILLAVCAITLFSVACKDKKESAAAADSENKWIYDQLKLWYLWEDQIPAFSATGNKLENQEYFNSLLYKKGDRAGDRFSYIEENKDYKAATKIGTKFQETGLGILAIPFILNKIKQEVAFFVAHVYKDSPNYNLLKRGDIIVLINGKSATMSDYSTILDSKDEFEITIGDIKNQEFGNVKTVKVSRTQFTKNPILECKVIDQEGRKIGYLAYEGFVKDSKEELNNAFLKMKQGGATELVLDMRYNSGGYVDVAIHLASLMVPSARLGETYLQMSYNSPLMNSSYPRRQTTLTTAEIKNCKLELSNLYVLSSSQTASASETTVHCMKPFLNSVKLIGDITVGKNQAAVEIKKDDHKWMLHPIFSRVMDAKGVTFSVDGITPDYLIYEELNNMKMLGDPTEELLAVALQKITTGAFPSPIKSVKSRAARTMSLENMVIDRSRKNGNIVTMEEFAN